MIRTALKATAIAATLAGATFAAAGPASADDFNSGNPGHGGVNVIVIGGSGVTCAVTGISADNCSGNRVVNKVDYGHHGHHGHHGYHGHHRWPF